MEMAIGLFIFVCALWLINNQYEKHIFNKAIGEPTRVILGMIESGDRFDVSGHLEFDGKYSTKITLKDKVTSATTSIERWCWDTPKYLFVGDLSWMNKQEQELIGEKCHDIIEKRYKLKKDKEMNEKKENDLARRKSAIAIYKQS